MCSYFSGLIDTCILYFQSKVLDLLIFFTRLPDEQLKILKYVKKVYRFLNCLKQFTDCNGRSYPF